MRTPEAEGKQPQCYSPVSNLASAALRRSDFFALHFPVFSLQREIGDDGGGMQSNGGTQS